MMYAIKMLRNAKKENVFLVFITVQKEIDKTRKDEKSGDFTRQTSM